MLLNEVNVLFPFVAFMVEDMGHSGSELGLYAGKKIIYMSVFRTFIVVCFHRWSRSLFLCRPTLLRYYVGKI